MADQTVLSTLNFVGAGVLALLGFGVLALAIRQEPLSSKGDQPSASEPSAPTQTQPSASALSAQQQTQPHRTAFLLFWAISWLATALNWLLQSLDQFSLPVWLEFAVDTVANFGLWLAAYALYCGANFDWRDRNLKTGYALLPFVMLFVAIPEFLVGTSKSWESWGLIFVVPNTMMSFFGLILVGLYLFLDLHKSALGLILFSILIIYAVPQLAYYATLVVNPNSNFMEHLQMFFVIGKIWLIVAFVVAVVSFYKADGVEKVVNSVRLVVNLARLVVAIIGIAVSVLFIILRLHQ
jgi:hypothetical protein